MKQSHPQLLFQFCTLILFIKFEIFLTFPNGNYPLASAQNDSAEEITTTVSPLPDENVVDGIDNYDTENNDNDDHEEDDGGTDTGNSGPAGSFDGRKIEGGEEDEGHHHQHDGTAKNVAVSGSSDEEEGSKRNRHFPKCKCRQKFRTLYITNNACGKAALCYWEIWNFRRQKAKSLDNSSFSEWIKSQDGQCDKYWVHKHTCLIGYPWPKTHSEHCTKGYYECEKKLGKLLYDECEPIRKYYNMRKPQEVDWEIRSENLNYQMRQDKDTLFKSLPNSAHPKWNNYYMLSCPIIYRFPYFTIDLLLKDMNPNIKYSETSALNGVAEMLPRYARIGMNNERILNFDALSLEESYVHWCGIPRNYVCVKVERDKDGKLCDEERLSKLRNMCEENPEDPRGVNRANAPLAVPSNSNKNSPGNS